MYNLYVFKTSRRFLPFLFSATSLVLNEVFSFITSFSIIFSPQRALRHKQRNGLVQLSVFAPQWPIIFSNMRTIHVIHLLFQNRFPYTRRRGKWDQTCCKYLPKLRLLSFLLSG